MGRVLHESDTYLAILEEGQVKGTREDILIVGEELFGSADESIKAQLQAVTDLARLKRRMSEPLLIDLRNMLSAEQVTARGFKYCAIGNGNSPTRDHAFEVWSKPRAATESRSGE